jgi:hypothetical protein
MAIIVTAAASGRRTKEVVVTAVGRGNGGAMIECLRGKW